MLLLNTYGGLLLSTVVLLSACATTSTQKYYSTGNATSCDDADKTLGYVAVLPEAAWRKDQKEPDMRQAMALEEIENAFYDLPCGMFSPPGGLRALSNWSQQSEMDLIKAFSEEGVDSIIIIIIRLEELTPRFFFTFSLPILWGGI